MTESTFEIIANVSPRSIGPSSLFESETSITCENVDMFHSDPTDVRDAKRELANKGFHIFEEGSDDTTISIGGTAKQFTDFFGARLSKQKTEVEEGVEVEFLGTGDEPDQQVMHAPGDLSNLIEGAVLTRPPTYFAPSPLPPLAPVAQNAYRYLFVPDEVAVILRSSRVHRMGVTGRNIVVGMLDSGHYRHPFFTWHGYRLLSTLLGPGTADPSQDMSGHGTGESANIFASAPDCRLRPVKMGSDTVGAFNVALGSSPKPQVLTNSWGYNADFPGSSIPLWLKPLEAKVANTVASGVVVCFAAGNGHRAFPACHPDVIAVGGVHVNYPKLDLEASSYASSFVSSFYPGRRVPDLCGLTGKKVNISGGKAPSLMLPVQEGAALDAILPSTGSNADGWGLFSGTSAACPQVAGVCALLLEKDPSATPAKVRQKLMESARDVTKGKTAMGDTATTGNDLATGAGLVDAKWSYLRTMGDVTATFLKAPKERQLSMIEAGAMPEMPDEFVEDLIDTLRSR